MGRVFRLLPWLLALVGAGTVLVASHPGYLNADSFNMLLQILARRFDDWHSPFILLLWSALHAVVPGPIGLVVLANGLMWGSLAWMAVRLEGRAGAPALLLLALPWLPGLFNFVGHVHKDLLLVAWMLLAFAAALAVRGAAADPGRASRLRAIAMLAAVAACLTRPNVVFALFPLLMLASAGIPARRRAWLIALVLAAMPLLYSLQARLLEVQERRPSESIKVYHLVALSYLTGSNLLPGDWSEPEAEAIVSSCYSPIQWDSAIWGHCSFIHRRLVAEGLWGSGRLTKAWFGAIAKHPLETYSAWAALYRLSVRSPNSWMMFRQVPAATPAEFKVARDPARLATRLAEAYAESDVVRLSSRPLLFAGLIFAALAVNGSALSSRMNFFEQRIGIQMVSPRRFRVVPIRQSV